jgi:HAD superfamily phosphoserine phosphatase-like hydrolase
MNVYDFDKTIYDGDSSIDFYVFNLKKQWSILIFVPAQLAAGLFYKLHLIDKTAMKQVFYSYFRFIPQMDRRLDEFWKQYSPRIKRFYQETHSSDDVIISASPEFLLKPICEALDVRMVGSIVDKKTGAYTGKNCYGEEKVVRFKQAFPASSIDTFYSDSLSDEPLAIISKKAVLVEGEMLKDWPIKER